MKSFEIHTENREMINITRQVAAAVKDSGISEGICLVYCPHTTAAITINENADPDVTHDLVMAMDKSFPDMPEFRHMEGNSAAHLKSSLVGASESVPVRSGKLALGTWQGIYFWEFDGPRTRRVFVQVTGG